MKEFVLGIDIGSSSVKLTLLGNDGLISGSTGCEYPTAYPKPGWCEQNPEDWSEEEYTEICRLQERVNDILVQLQEDERFVPTH